jgi:hypothetical protein
MTDKHPPAKPDRAERLAAALRANLRRRKAADASPAQPKPSPPKADDDT